MSPTRDEDIEIGRSLYADLLALEARMEEACEPMYHCGCWINATGALRKARESF